MLHVMSRLSNLADEMMALDAAAVRSHEGMGAAAATHAAAGTGDGSAPHASIIESALWDASSRRRR